MNDTVVGWIFVAAQVVLLAAVVLLPSGNAWTVDPWLARVGGGVFFAGLAIVAIASVRLGRGLTPTPVPAAHATLATSGLYSMVRHPIYSGVLLVVAGITVRSASWATASVAVTTLVFFNLKAAWEERRLSAKYHLYGEYVARTPRFIPRIRRT